ncbi:hypothetical protein RB195_010316 [Necator americanus]|uniref:Uncharacterized protein n=1 Tax=Necator americanus TaxID=51031 RepID=A0ABR1CXD6_NECAM
MHRPAKPLLSYCHQLLHEDLLILRTDKLARSRNILKELRTFWCRGAVQRIRYGRTKGEEMNSSVCWMLRNREGALEPLSSSPPQGRRDAFLNLTLSAKNRTRRTLNRIKRKCLKKIPHQYLGKALHP